MTLDTLLRTRTQKQRCPRVAAPAFQPCGSSAGFSASPLGEDRRDAVQVRPSLPAHTQPDGCPAELWHSLLHLRVSPVLSRSCPWSQFWACWLGAYHVRGLSSSQPGWAWGREGCCSPSPACTGPETWVERGRSPYREPTWSEGVLGACVRGGSSLALVTTPPPEAPLVGL